MTQLIVIFFLGTILGSLLVIGKVLYQVLYCVEKIISIVSKDRA